MEAQDFSILYVDDERHNLTSFKATFRREFNFLLAQSGSEGLELLNQHQVQLIISDQRMPGMTGVKFLENTLGEFPDAIRMILTGYSDVEAIIDAINTGKVFRYITKPWDETELRVTINNARTMYTLQEKNKQLIYDLKQKVEEQERILKLFAKYVPEAVVARALEQTDQSIFDGETKYISVLFCDIRGFTTLSEGVTPQIVVALLNDYYSLMTEVIKKHNGYAHQFTGDEIFATFGTPVASSNNEENAVFCAIEMIQKLEQLNKTYGAIIGQTITIGIGIHAGEVVAGNLGSEAKISYSVTGDAVNTGKRIEAATRDFPNTILISDTVYHHTKDKIQVKAWDALVLRGKKEKIQVYEVFGKVPILA